MKATREEAEDAVRVLLSYTGDDPTREGLLDTPARAVRAFDEWFRGYTQNPPEMLSRTFSESEGYDEIVLLRNIRVESHCEHHLVPIVGRAHVAYLPKDRVVGISKLARVVEAYAKRLQIQEKMTAQVADCIQSTLDPRGVIVVVEAQHLCMTTRGVHQPGVDMVTSAVRGVFRENDAARAEALGLINAKK